MDDGIIRVRRIKNPEMEIESVEAEEVMDSRGVYPRESGGGNDTTEGERGGTWYAVGRACLYAIAALTPIFFLPFTVSPVDISKTALVGALTLVAAVAFLIGAIERRRIPYPRFSLALAALLLVIAYGASAAFSKAPVVSWHGGLAGQNSFLVVAIGFVLFFLTSYFLEAEDVPRLGKVLGVSVALAAVFGALQAYGRFILPWDFAKGAGFTTVGSLYGWGIMLGAALAATTVLPFARLSRRAKIFITLFGLLLFFGLLILNYDLIWVGLAFIMVMISAARFVARESLGLPMAVGVIAVFLALVSGRIPRLTPLPFEIRPSFGSSFSAAKDALGWRRLAIGTGPGTFAYDYDLHRPRELNQTPFWSARFNQGYNYLVTAFAEVGLLGILALALLLWTFFRFMIRALAYPDTLPVVAGTLFLMIAWLFYPSFFNGWVLFFFGLGTLAAMTGMTRDISLEALSPAKSFLGFMATILLIALALSGFYFLGQKYYAAVAYGRAAAASAAGRVERAVDHMNTAIRWDPSSDQYFRAASQLLLTRASRLALSGGSASDVQVAIANAVQAALRATQLNPADEVNWSNAGSVYENLITTVSGADGYAVEAYRQAMMRAPANPQEPVAAARALFAAANLIQGASDRAAWQSRIDAAKEFLAKSLELKPDYAAARYLLAQIFLREGDFASAVAKTEEIKTLQPLDAGVAFQLGLLYYDAGRLDQARAELERAVALAPDYANAKYFLGLIYDRKGMTSEALAEFRRIGELNPANQEVRTIIENLRAGRRALDGIVPPLPPPEDRSGEPVPEKKQ